MFTSNEYSMLHCLVFKAGYPGYRPEVKEIPNGDGKVDQDKRYAHIAPKYLVSPEMDHFARMALSRIYNRAFEHAYALAEDAGIPRAFLPHHNYGALRVLDYPPGSIANLHRDFDLFTTMLYRDQPDKFVADHDNGQDVEVSKVLQVIRSRNVQAHLGLLAEEIGLGQATPHEVLPSTTTQRSIVYFAIPDHAAVLPSGVTVGDWLKETMSRTRTTSYKAE